MSSPYAPMLAKLAIRRQADVDQATFSVYLEDLASEQVDPRDLRAACERLGTTERASFDTAFPSVGTLLTACREARKARREAEYRAIEAIRPRLIAPPTLTHEEASAWLEKIREAAGIVRRSS